MSKLDDIKKEAEEKLASVSTIPELDQWKSIWLGKKGPLADALKGVKDLPPEERREFGGLANRVKKELTERWEAYREEIEARAIREKLDKDWIDPTCPNLDASAGHAHPISSFTREIEEIFKGMGFEVLEGPLAEDDWHNFEALNIPPDHPARDMQDTFWLKSGGLLRTHTSSVQIRSMERLKPPLRGIAPGRVFRCEEIDASHENTFYQLEGLVVDKDISVSHLIFSMKTLLKGIFKREVEVRLRPGYFPFVEPGFELDIRCLVCEGKGCSVCKQIGWVELLPCGLVHPNVLKACKIDPEEWSGFAFGLGLSRLVMMRYGINDIRHFLSGDLRFVRQFK